MPVHCKKEKYDVYIGRPSIWGNPFKISEDITRSDAISLYGSWLMKQPELLARLPELTGKILGCYCAPLTCHGDVLEKLANQDKITQFRGKHFFLSNFYPASVGPYPTSEHAYQAGKTQNRKERKKIRLTKSPKEAKRLGRHVTLRKNWNKINLDIMYKVVKTKFLEHRDLTCKLLATCKADLIEGNNWNDTFWGVCNGRGENHLGRILMKVREEIRRNF